MAKSWSSRIYRASAVAFVYACCVAVAPLFLLPLAVILHLWGWTDEAMWIGMAATTAFVASLTVVSLSLIVGRHSSPTLPVGE